jgi:hypothetical protein
MSESHLSEDHADAGSHDGRLTALFQQLVMQQASMAMMLLGKTAHPDTGKTFKDIEAARLFIDELEMLEAKTKGNLAKEEATFLKQTLMSLRMSFVEAVESPEASEPSRAAAPADKSTAPPDKAATEPSAPAAAEEERHKKFSKKY